LIAALERTTVLGVTTNRAFLLDVLRHPTFADGAATTAFLEDAGVGGTRDATSAEWATAAAWLHFARERRADARSPGLSGWTNAGVQRTTQRLSTRARTVDVSLARSAAGLTACVDGVEHHVERCGERLVVDGVAVDVAACSVSEDRVLLRFPHLDLDVC